MSEPNAEETKKSDQDDLADFLVELDEKERENGRKEAEKKRMAIDPKTLFSSDPLLHQLEMQVGLLTSAMTENMVLAAGAAPELTEGPYPDVPRFGAGSASVERPVSWADARSLHLRDAARLSFATASLIGAYSKLKGMAPQRITARYTIVPGTGKRTKPRTITTLTHSVIATPDPAARTTQQG